MANSVLLVLNAGSSSLKFALFDADRPECKLVRGAVAGIGTDVAHLAVEDLREGAEHVEAGRFDTHHAALDAVLGAALGGGSAGQLVAIGHRVAHGGPDCDCPMPVTPALRARLRDLIPLAPLHLPANIAGIEAVAALRPDLPQIACFDTAFHNPMPRVAQMTGLPREMETPELRRYGYHGLSYEYIVSALARDGVDLKAERIIVAHLGNGASLAAIRGGRSVETTMGFSTISGVPMGTRSGDIDPGLVLHLQTEHGMTADALEDLLTNRAGLLGLSGISRDMRVLLDHPDEAAAEAIRYFCYHVRRHLVALTAPLEGVDRVVFTGGIGANAAPVRALVCAGLHYLGITLNKEANAENRPVISAAGAPVTVEVRQTDEEAMIADHVARLCPACETAKEAC
jgi:acetate kinase